MMKRSITAMFLVTSVMALKANASVWEATEKWDMAHEARFGQWIKTMSPDVFSNPSSKYYGIATDCADAAYTLRTIFAYENRLPVKFQNNERMSNTSNAYDSIANEWERVKRFIRRLNYDTGTYSLPGDTYPVAINRSNIRAGIMFVHASSGADVPVTYRAGHVYYLQDVRENGQIKYISSTVPQAVRELGVRIGIQFAPQEKSSGYRAWKWPDSNDRPGYSEEQYAMGGWRAKAYGDGELWDRWQEAVQSRIRTRHVTPQEEFLGSAENLRSALRERASAVMRGWNLYRKNYQSGTCMNISDYDDHSTPTRDVKIQNELQNFEAAAKKWVLSDYKAMKQSFFDTEETRLQRLYNSFQVEVISGRRLGFTTLYDLFMTTKVLEISEPEHSPEVRWGLQSQGRWVCPHRAKQYRGGHLVAQ
ncbi:MAG: hypothetical protein ACK5P7_13400 [Bdellovibrio sp.]